MRFQLDPPPSRDQRARKLLQTNPAGYGIAWAACAVVLLTICAVLLVEFIAAVGLGAARPLTMVSSAYVGCAVAMVLVYDIYAPFPLVRRRSRSSEDLSPGVVVELVVRSVHVSFLLYMVYWAVAASILVSTKRLSDILPLLPAGDRVRLPVGLHAQLVAAAFDVILNRSLGLWAVTCVISSGICLRYAARPQYRSHSRTRPFVRVLWYSTYGLSDVVWNLLVQIVRFLWFLVQLVWLLAWAWRGRRRQRKAPDHESLNASDYIIISQQDVDCSNSHPPLA